MQVFIIQVFYVFSLNEKSFRNTHRVHEDMNCDLKISSMVVHCERLEVSDRPNMSTVAAYPKQVQRESGETLVFGFV